MREAELRVRGPGASRARAKVLVDPVGGWRKTVARQLAAGEVGKVRREIARHAEFAATVEQIIEVNEKICEARPAAGGAAGEDPSGTGGEKGGSGRRSRRRSPPG